MFTKIDESKRRRVNFAFDKITPAQQKAYYSFSKKYIKNKTILDVGCWTGRYTSFASKYAKKAVGVDPSHEAINDARREIPQASFLVGAVNHLPFKDKSFDAVIFLAVLEHIPEGTESQALIEIHRVLKQNGYLILETPNKHPLSILLDPAYFLIGHRHYSRTYLCDLLRRVGFTIMEFYNRGGTLYQITAILELIAKHILRRPLLFSNWIEKRIQISYSKRGYAAIRIIAKKA